MILWPCEEFVGFSSGSANGVFCAYTASERQQRLENNAVRRYAPRRWQFDLQRINVRPRTGPQSAHLWWPASAGNQRADNL